MDMAVWPSPGASWRHEFPALGVSVQLVAAVVDEVVVVAAQQHEVVDVGWASDEPGDYVVGFALRRGC